MPTRVFLLLVLLSSTARGQDTNETDISGILESYPGCAHDCLTQRLSSCPLPPSSFTHSPNPSTTSPSSPSSLPACLCNSDNRPLLASCFSSSCPPIPFFQSLNITSHLCHDLPRDRGSTSLTTLTTTLGILSPLFVLARLLFRILTHPSSRLGVDDWIISVSIPLGIPYTILIAHTLSRAGIGRDVWTLTPDQITWFLKVFYVLIEYYVVLMAYVKLPFLFMYLRIFGESARIKRVLWGTIVVVGVVGVVFVLPLGCRPVSFFWEGWDGEHQGRCGNVNTSAWTQSIVTIVLDLWIMAIPLSQLRKLNMDWKKKLAVGLMLCVGVFDTIISIIRLHSLLAFQPSTNVTWDYYPVAVWSAVEYHVAVICACLPAMRQLLVRVFPRLESNIGKSDGSNGGDGDASGARRNVPRSGTDQYQWYGQQHQSSRGLKKERRRKGELWTREVPTETESERNIVLGSFRRSGGSHNVEVLEADDVERGSVDGRMLAGSSMDSTEKREGFGLSIVGCWMEEDRRRELEGRPPTTGRR
ncbi:hypothetical protein B0T20DRAFT_350108 [Sordaria brevicollis]|uniref:Rhodopsin domain-containing protein n=1 Tax=Sordaria brevicollis TaxID=83679 RepID=A0AAE0PI49_SORBR|nr:hypothetical protein B0T20DRAFT_350108 [Sordaria brevicollis]